MKLPDLRKTRLSSVSTFGVVSILGTSMIIIAIVAIAAIRGAGAYSLKQTKEAIKTEAVKLLQENTKRKADEYSRIFQEATFNSTLLVNQIKGLLNESNCFKFNNKEYGSLLKGFEKNTQNKPYIKILDTYRNWIIYWGKEISNVQKEIYLLHYFSNIFRNMVLNSLSYNTVWMTDFENLVDFYYYKNPTKRLSSIQNIKEGAISLQKQKLKYLHSKKHIITNLYKDYYNDYLVLTISTNLVPSSKKYKICLGIDILFDNIAKDILNHNIPLIGNTQKHHIGENSNSFIISQGEGEVLAMAEKLHDKLKLPQKNISNIERVGDYNLSFNNSTLKCIRNLSTKIKKAKEFPIVDYVMLDKHEYIFCFSKMSVKNWIFGVAVPTEELYRAVSETEARMGVTVMGFIINFLMVAVFFMFILLIVVVLFFKTYLVKPILSFRDNVLQMGDGDLDTPIKERGVYEISVLANSFNNLRVDLKNHMEGLRSEVIKRQKRDNELKTARQVQLSVLPKITSLFDNKGIELYAKLLPAIDVAGDYYDFFFLENKKLALIIADVSGKGISASFYMAVTKRTLRNTCITEPDDPAKSIELANKILCSYNINMFVTLFLAYYDTETGEMVYANGGHNEVICLKNDGSLDVFGVLNCAALGTFPELPYVKDTYTLDHGDTIYVYTDGIIEANTGDENFYGMKRFEDLLVKNREKSLSKICKLVIQDVHQFEKGGQFDDITILAIKRI